MSRRLSIPTRLRRPSGKPVRVRYFAAAAAALILAVLLVSLLKSEPRLAASNTRVIRSKNGVPIAPKEERCQGGEYVPSDADRLRVYPGTARIGTPPLQITLRDSVNRVVARIPVPGGYPGNVPNVTAGKPLDVPLPAHGPSTLGSLCIRNLGSQTVQFAGNLISINPASPGGINGPGERPGDEVRADYYLSGRRTGLSIAGRVVDRASLLRPGFIGSWTIWLILALFVAACVAMVIWLVRRLEEEAR